MKKNKIYVVVMKRWGDNDLHSYVSYAGFSKHTAIEAGKKEMEYRGNKYEPFVYEFTPDKPETRKEISLSV